MCFSICKHFNLTRCSYPFLFHIIWEGILSFNRYLKFCVNDSKSSLCFINCMHKWATRAYIVLDFQMYLFILYPWDRVPEEKDRLRWREVHFFVLVASGLRPWGWGRHSNQIQFVFGRTKMQRKKHAVGLWLSLCSSFIPSVPPASVWGLHIWMSRYPSVNPLELSLMPHLHLCGHLLDDQILSR